MRLSAEAYWPLDAQGAASPPVGWPPAPLPANSSYGWERLLVSYLESLTKKLCFLTRKQNLNHFDPKEVYDDHLPPRKAVGVGGDDSSKISLKLQASCQLRRRFTFLSLGLRHLTQELLTAALVKVFGRTEPRENARRWQGPAPGMREVLPDAPRIPVAGTGEHQRRPRPLTALLTAP